tara:strand:- start:8 stop:331 length:324 start_codon:yes stop_codon:yes gene_type:complete
MLTDNMRVYLGGLNIVVTQQLLNSTNIATALQQVRSERVTKSVTINFFEDLRLNDCWFKSLSNDATVKMMSTKNASVWMCAQRRRWKDEHPTWLLESVGIFSIKCTG